MASDLTARFDKGAAGCRVEAWRRTGKPFPVSTMGGGSGWGDEVPAARVDGPDPA